MAKSIKVLFFAITGLLTWIGFLYLTSEDESDEQLLKTAFYAYTVDPKIDRLDFVYKNAEGKRYSNINSLKIEAEQKSNKLIFATNGGMYKPDQSPVGLYIENGKTLTEIDKAKNGYGNFYLQPNGVLFIRDTGDASIVRTQDYVSKPNIKWATQSGPMLLVDKKINSLFGKKSTNKHIRNGVGVMPDGKLIFAMSKKTVTFHTLAKFFQQQGCVNALYLDGFVSRMYVAEGEDTPKQLDGNFGVIIRVVK